MPPNLRLPVLAVLTACVFPGAVMGAEDSQATKSQTATANSPDQPPFITHNPDGTMTVQKPPSKGTTKDHRREGLVIPPQVVVPFVPARKGKRNDQRGCD
jgi:hypothetical protein